MTKHRALSSDRFASSLPCRSSFRLSRLAGPWFQAEPFEEIIQAKVVDSQCNQR
jgi:hypothetical protein